MKQRVRKPIRTLVVKATANSVKFVAKPLSINHLNDLYERPE